MKKLFVLFLSFCIFSLPLSVKGYNLTVSEVDNNPDYEENGQYITVDASVPVDAALMTFAKAVVLMEKSTGKVLYAENEDEKLYPAYRHKHEPQKKKP